MASSLETHLLSDSGLRFPVRLCCVSWNGGAPHYARQKLYGLEIWWVGWELRYSYWWCQDMFIFFIQCKFGSRCFSGSCSCLLLINNEEQRCPGEQFLSVILPQMSPLGLFSCVPYWEHSLLATTPPGKCLFSHVLEQKILSRENMGLDIGIG